MTILKTQLNPRSADFQANVDAMRTVVADLHEKVDKIALGGPEAARQKHLARGKLLPRERVSGLLDQRGHGLDARAAVQQRRRTAAIGEWRGSTEVG